MGCGAGKEDKKEKKRDDTIPYEMQDCKIPKFMELFSNAETLLKNAEEIRAGILDSKSEAMEIIEGDRLIDPTLYDALKALFIVLAAENGGKFPLTALEVKSEAPYIMVYCGDQLVEIYQLNEQIKTFLATLITAPAKIIEIITACIELQQQAQEFPSQVQDAATSAGLGPFQIPVAAKNTASNVATMGKGIPKLTVLKEVVQTAAADVQTAVKKIQEEKSQFDEWGQLAHQKGIKKPRDVITEFWPKERFKPVDPEAEKAKAEKKKKAESKAKDNKKKPEEKKIEEKKTEEQKTK